MHSLHGYSVEVWEHKLVHQCFADYINNEPLDFADVAQDVGVGVSNLGFNLEIGQEALAYALSVGCRAVEKVAGARMRGLLSGIDDADMHAILLT